MARRRKEEGHRLNCPSRWPRKGHTLAELSGRGVTCPASDDVLPVAVALMPLVQLEGFFPDGSTMHEPARRCSREHRFQCQGTTAHSPPSEMRVDSRTVALRFLR